MLHMFLLDMRRMYSALRQLISGLLFRCRRRRNGHFRELGQVSRSNFQANNSTARVWKNWECVYTLKGHESSVWAVLALPNDEYLTGLSPAVSNCSLRR